MKTIKPKNKISDFELLVTKSISRRNLLKSGISFGLSSFILGTASKSVLADNKKTSFDFNQVKSNTLDTVTLPDNYTWQTVIRWGDPMWSEGEEFNNFSRGNANSQKLSFGDNNDGMHLFNHNGHNILVVNNEYTNQKIIYGNRDSKSAENIDDINKGKAAHGISIVELSFKKKWEVVKDSAFNRRITADTPMELSGYARGHELLKTSFDKNGTKCLGTWNNCGNGKTPWGTYLACGTPARSRWLRSLSSRARPTTAARGTRWWRSWRCGASRRPGRRRTPATGRPRPSCPPRWRR